MHVGAPHQQGNALRSTHRLKCNLSFASPQPSRRPSVLVLFGTATSTCRSSTASCGVTGAVAPRAASSRGECPLSIQAVVAFMSQYSLTLRSSGAPTACRQGPVCGTRYIFAHRALASRRRGPLSSTLGNTKCIACLDPRDLQSVSVGHRSCCQLDRACLINRGTHCVALIV